MGYLFSQFKRSVGVFFRTIRAFLSRKLLGVGTALRRLTNFSRNATKAATSSIQEVVSAAQKPSGPSDYVETGRLLISKALIIRLLLGLAALGLILYFLVWPFVLSRFLTARFYEKDERVEDWSGRVIVYSDPKKTVPLYSGRLEKGLLQGECRQYDGSGVLLYEGMIQDGERTGNGRLYENGVLVYAGQLSAGLCSGFGERYDAEGLVYSGQYEDGKRSGNGRAYENGALLYEGQFADDLYEGRGRLYEDGVLCYDGGFAAGAADGTGTAYADGKLLYEGQYAGGLYEGRGKLYENGVLRYDGLFRGGREEGTGTAYDPDGRISYQGEFLAGERDGSGVAYGEDGSKIYEGGFSKGQYSGTGTLYDGAGGQLEAEFLEGEPTGNVIWKKNGFLYYQGEWSEGAPNGFGTLYSKAGKKLYEGPFLGGTLDGSALLGDTAEELRTALCESSLENATAKTGYYIIAGELGLSALCSFQTETEDSRVSRLTLSAPEKDDWAALLPGRPHTLPVRWPEGAEVRQLTVEHAAGPGEHLAAGSYAAEQAMAEGRLTTVLYGDQTRTGAVLLAWERADAGPGPLPSGGSGKDSKVEKLLDAMEKMISSEGTFRSKGAVFGELDPGDYFGLTGNMDNAVALADAMIDFWLENQRLCALEERAERCETLISDAQDEIARGVGSGETVAALQQAQTELKAQMETTRTAIRRAELTAASWDVTWMSGLFLEDMLISFDPGLQDVSGLVLFAEAYAKATGSGEDREELARRVKESLLDLSDAHSAAKLALARYQASAEGADSALDDYSMGLIGKRAWYEAMDAETQARAELCAALAEFSKQANHFNYLTGGWVSRTFDWQRDVFEPLLRAAILPGEELPGEAPEQEAAEAPEAPAAGGGEGEDGPDEAGT